MRVFRLFILLCIFWGNLAVHAQNDTVVFSASGGFYDDVFALQLSNIQPQNHIRYTTNGNPPTAQSPLYSAPLSLDGSQYTQSDIYTLQISPDDLVYVPDSVSHCIVIRAAAFDEGDSCVSRVVTNSYFIRALGCNTHGLPAVSICADSLDLFDYERGIMVQGVHFNPYDPQHTGNYYQKGMEWERLVNVEYSDYENLSGVNQLCGLRTHGNRARRQPQKGLKIYAREEYGKKRFKYKFFETSMLNDFKHLVLKPFSTLYPFTSIQDYICTQTAINMGLEAGQSRPVVLFLNGEYWGVYFLQEKMDERFLEDHFNIDIEHCNIVGDWNGLADCGGPIDADGNLIEFMEMMQWLDTANLSQTNEYQRLETLININNFIDYIILETFVANNDWPGNNMRCWKMDGGRWRWIFYDGDAAFNNFSLDPFSNSIPLDVFGNATYLGPYDWPSSEAATRMFRRCLENAEFVLKFENRMSELIQGVLAYDNMSRYYLCVKEQLAPEILPQSFRFDNPPSRDYWNWGCTLTDKFLSNRTETYLAEWAGFNGVNENEHDATFICYPNPSSGAIHICFESNEAGPYEIAMYDITGRMVFEKTYYSLDCNYNILTIQPQVPAGIYVIKVGGYTQRIVRY